MRSPLGTLVRNQAPVSYAPRGLTFPWTHRNNAEAQMRAMGNVGTLFAIVNRTSTAAASADWHLWRKAASGKDEDRVEVTRHAALTLWNKPNPFYSRQEYVETEQQHVDLTGEGWWVVARHPMAKSIPIELWPVRPDRMTPVPHATEFLAGYIYTGPNGEQVPLGLDEVIQIRMPNPLDPYRGMGPVQSILVDLDSERYTAEWNLNFFRNGAEPGGIVEVDKRLSDDEFAEMTTRWREQHQGVANAHRVAILEQGKWIDRKFSQRDMQFAELRAVSKDTIREAFGMPKFAVGDVADINRATAEASKAWFGEQITVPRLDRFKGALNNDLLPMFGPTAEGLEFDYDSPVPADADAANAERVSKATAAKTYIDCGARPATVQIALDLPAALEWEHRPSAPAPAAPPAPPAAPPAGPPQARRPHYPAAHRPRNDADLDPDDLPDVSGLQDTWTAALTALLLRWADIVADWIDWLVNKIRSIARGDDLTALADLTVDSSAAAAALEEAMAALADDAAEQLVAEAAEQGITLAPDGGDTDLMAQVADVVADLLGSDLSTSAARAAMAANGPPATADEVADAVREHLEALTDAQPQQQLGAALTGAQNAARTATLRGGPVGAVYASEKNDKNTCAPCREVNGRWLGNTDDMDQVERSYPGGGFGGYRQCRGGPRCRGTVVGVWRPAQTGSA